MCTSTSENSSMKEWIKWIEWIERLLQKLTHRLIDCLTVRRVSSLWSFKDFVLEMPYFKWGNAAWRCIREISHMRTKNGKVACVVTWRNVFKKSEYLWSGSFYFSTKSSEEWIPPATSKIQVKVKSWDSLTLFDCCTVHQAAQNHAQTHSLRLGTTLVWRVLLSALS